MKPNFSLDLNLSEEELNLMAAEISDFDLVDPIYEVLLTGYDEQDAPTNYIKYLQTFLSEEEACDFATAYKVTEIPKLPTVYIRIEVTLKIMSGDIQDTTFTRLSRVAWIKE